MRGEGREEKGGVEGKGGLSGNVAEEAFCLKSAPADNVAYKYNTMKCVIVRYLLNPHSTRIVIFYVVYSRSNLSQVHLHFR